MTVLLIMGFGWASYGLLAYLPCALVGWLCGLSDDHTLLLWKASAVLWGPPAAHVLAVDTLQTVMEDWAREDERDRSA